MKFQFDHIKIIIARIKKKNIKTAVIMVIIVILVIIFPSSLALANRNKIPYGLKIANISIGGASFNEAEIKIEKSTNEFLKKDIVLRYKKDKKDSETWTVLLEELGVKIDFNSTLKIASKIGHQKKFFTDIGQQILSFLGCYNLSLNYGLNEVELEKFIREKLNSIDKPAVNASLVFNQEKNDFIVIPSKEGEIINRADFKLQISKKIEKLTKNDIFLTLIDEYPEVLEEEIKEAYAKTQKILERAPYKLVVKDPQKIAPPKITLTKGELISLIEFRTIEDKNNPENKVLGVNLKKQALNDYLISLGSSINRKPIDAQLILQENRVVNFSLSQDGLKLEIEKNINKIREEILEKDEKEIELETSVIHPKIATKNINNLGITSLLAKGESNFSGSPKNRIHNIGVGAAKFNGVLIKPGEEFSFNTMLGEVGPEQGYKAELVIKRDKTIPEYGGGLCQVSTTAFRAAFNTGLPIRERAAHAFPVKYYNPQGFDATIYPPHPDLRFINDTPGYVLIQTKIKDNELIFEFYGTSDGRRVEIEGPIQYDIKPDGSMKAQLIRRIFDKDGNFIKESIFNSNYKSPALYPIEKNPLE